MDLNLSYAQIGVIIKSLQEQYPFPSEGYDLSTELADKVYMDMCINHPYGEQFYEMWLGEFSISQY